MQMIDYAKLFTLELPKTTCIFFHKSYAIINGPRGIVIFSQFLEKNKYIISFTNNSLSILDKQSKIESQSSFKLLNLFKNIIFGVNFLFPQKLSLVGIGFRIWIKVKKETKILVIKAGFSKDLYIPIPKNILVYSLRPTLLLIRGLQKNKVTQFCSLIRSYKKPDKYKGKGIQYRGEVLSLKPGKKN